MSVSVCPECHKSIPPAAPAGQCPECLLKRGLERAGFASAAFALTTPQGGRQIPLTPEFIAPCFPQMEILELLGQGGMGTVFKARQTKLDRMVAVKIIRPETASDPAFAERFMREAKTLARLNHPNIVSVHDFGEVNLAEISAGLSVSGGTLFFFIMEYVDGANLRQLMQSGKMSPELTLRIIQQVCDALQFAHEEGIVHRDIKPENIMLDAKGRVKIADFGLARLADQSAVDWTLTGTHQVIGTPRYMAPEQLASSRDVDHRADIYSLAVVFYEMLTGTIPVGHFAPPSRKVAVDVRFDEVILKAMAGEPGERFQSVRELRSAVDQIVAGTAFGRSHESIAGTYGLSTILDQQVAGAWRLFTGRSPENSAVEQAATSATTTFAGIAAVGIAGLLASVFGGTSRSDEPDFVLRLISLGAFALIAFLWVALPTRLRSSGWAYGGSLLLSILTTISVLVGAAASRTGGDTFDRLYAIPILCALSLGMLSLSGIRRAIFEDRGQPSVPRSDSVVVTREQLEQGILPDICMISGVPTSNRVSHTIEHQPKWAEAVSLIGFILGGFPGLFVYMITMQTFHVSCPICNQHEGHWRNRNVFASIAWMLVPLAGMFGVIIGFQYPGITGKNLGPSLGIAMGILGLLSYLIPVIWMSWRLVKIEQISDGNTSDTQVVLRRVCMPFAEEVRRRQAALHETSRTR